MKNTSNRVAIVLSAFFLLGLLPSSASAWWKCPVGYQFKLNSAKNKVKCYRSEKTYTKALKKCPKVKVLGIWIGSSFKRDYIRGKEDSCISKDPTGIFTTAVPHSFCPYSGYKHIKLRGRKDKCIKRIRAKETYPSRNVR